MRPPTLRLAFGDDEIIVDSFAGGGGASLGIEWALGRSPDIAINHNHEALAIHRANHPRSEHFLEDVWHVDPVKACQGRPVGLMWLSPDCFPAGTMVLTREGYRPIEEIEIGDEVLTHRLQWRRVIDTMTTIKPLVRLRGHGHPGLLVSPEHPFLARARSNAWDNAARTYRRVLGGADWVRAGQLERDWYWASPTSFPVAEVPPIPVRRGRKVTVTAEILWLAGLYVADGWTRLTDRRAELVITCGRHEVEGLRAKLAAWPRHGARSGADEMVFHERDTRTAHQFTASHRGFVEWLREHFGHGAAEKRIPGWVLGMSRELRDAFLAGYLSGDGCRSEGGGAPLIIATTVSKALAFGIKALAASLGHTPTVYLADNCSVIQGRKVNARPAWSVRWRESLEPLHAQTFREDDMEWAPVRAREDDVSAAAVVYNLSVEGDESYVADGIVVHNCTHFSKAKGGKPVNRKRRGLAWLAVRWAKAVAPRVMVLENVEEFLTWGPVGDDNKPIPIHRGRTFRAWARKIRALGYQMEWNLLTACDFGAPTSRRRLFIIMRRDGLPIIWPEATHGPGRLPLRTAAECIDWSRPTPSIFARKRPLAPNTMRRIARGVRKYVITAKRPFIIPVTHQGDVRVHSVDAPMPTVTGAHRGEHALVAPLLAPVKTWGGGGNDAAPLDRPMRTITTSKRGEFALVAPTLIGIDHQSSGASATWSAAAPLTTVTTEARHALVSAFLAKHYGGGYKGAGAQLDMPLHTVTTQDHHALVATHLLKMRGGLDDHGVTAAPMDGPVPTITASGTHLAEVRAFLVAYYGTDQGGALELPMPTITTHDRFGLVVVEGVPYQIADIGMRMLEPRELFRAQGFPDSYQIEVKLNGKTLSKAAQVSACGNSVSPYCAMAIVAANLTPAEAEAEQVA